jgi:hypothetical protein
MTGQRGHILVLDDDADGADVLHLPPRASG